MLPRAYTATEEAQGNPPFTRAVVAALLIQGNLTQSYLAKMESCGIFIVSPSDE